MASGSKSMKQYEAAVFEKLGAVPLSLVGHQTLVPFDLLVKQPSKEKKKGFVVRRVGNLYTDKNLRIGRPLMVETAGNDDDGEEAEEIWPLAVVIDDQQGQTPKVVTRKVVDAKTTDLVSEGNRSGGFFSSLLTLLNIKTLDCKSFRYDVSGIRSITIDTGQFMDSFTGPEPDISINVESILSRDSGFKRNKDGELEVWVVTDLFWCNKLAIQATDGKGRLVDIQANGDLVATALIGVPIPIELGLKAGYTWVRRQTNLEVQSAEVSGKPVWIAFKAIRLVYGGESGDKLVNNYLNVEDTPRRRARSDNISKEEHMLGLFDDQGEYLEPPEIVAYEEKPEWFGTQEDERVPVGNDMAEPSGTISK